MKNLSLCASVYIRGRQGLRFYKDFTGIFYKATNYAGWPGKVFAFLHGSGSHNLTGRFYPGSYRLRPDRG